MYIDEKTEFSVDDYDKLIDYALERGETPAPLNDPLQVLLQRQWNAQECEDCGHPNARHDTVKGYCVAERSTEADGIEVDGICGCMAGMCAR